MKKIKVLHTITRMIVGGASENTMLSAQLIDKEKFTVKVISGRQVGSSGSLLEECKKRNVKIHYFNGLVREISPLNDLIHIIKFVDYLKKNKFDIIHTHSSKAGILHRIAAKLAGIPIIVHTIHGWSFNCKMPSWKRKLYIVLERFTAKLTTKLIAVTQFDIEKGLKERIGNRNQYCKIHSAIEIERYEKPEKPVSDIKVELGIESDKVIIGTVSRMDEQKAPLDFMRAAQKIIQEYDNVQFLFIGDGPLKSEVMQFISENNLQHIILTPGLRYDVPNMLAVMDIFILTSLWEGLPRVFSQAMAARKPIIATRVDGAPEIICSGENGFLVDPGDIDSMCGRIETLLINQELCKKFSENGYERISPDFDVNHMIRQLEELYIDLINRKNK